jgi:hypothetical protein
LPQALALPLRAPVEVWSSPFREGPRDPSEIGSPVRITKFDPESSRLAAWRFVLGLGGVAWWVLIAIDGVRLRRTTTQPVA